LVFEAKIFLLGFCIDCNDWDYYSDYFSDYSSYSGCFLSISSLIGRGLLFKVVGIFYSFSIKVALISSSVFDASSYTS